VADVRRPALLSVLSLSYIRRIPTAGRDRPGSLIGECVVRLVVNGAELFGFDIRAQLVLDLGERDGRSEQSVWDHNGTPDDLSCVQPLVHLDRLSQRCALEHRSDQAPTSELKDLGEFRPGTPERSRYSARDRQA
jgi:hypothetical protein